MTLFLYCTSVWHWHKPRFKSWARKFDYLAVITTVAYASYVATTLEKRYTIVWFCGITMIGIIYATKKYVYYIQVKKNFHGVDISPTDTWATKPHTVERENAFKRTAWVHLIFVHLFAASLAFTIIIGSGPVRQAPYL